MRLPTFRIINKDVIAGIADIADSSVDICVTSPPYYAQRNYGVEGQLGREKTSQEYVDKMVDVFYNHLYRVMKPHSLLFINLGDSYAGSGGQGSQSTLFKEGQAEFRGVMSKSEAQYKPRDLMGVPNRVFEGLRQAGYYWRSTVIWAKPNGMPESVTGVRWVRHQIKVQDDQSEGKGKQGQFGNPTYTGFNERYFEGKGAQYVPCEGCEQCAANDGYILKWGSGRPTSKYELIGILTKENYYWDTEATRTAYAEATKQRSNYPVDRMGGADSGAKNNRINDSNRTMAEGHFMGAALGNVWTIATASSGHEHYAMFPERLPETCILAGSSEKGCCPICGAPYARMLDRVGKVQEGAYSRTADVNGLSESSALRGQGVTVYQTVGWKATCECNAQHNFDLTVIDSHGYVHCTLCQTAWDNINPVTEPCVVPSVVLDVFSGAGTTGLVANRHGRDYIGIELNPEYAAMSERRIRGDAPLLHLEENDGQVLAERSNALLPEMPATIASRP